MSLYSAPSELKDLASANPWLAPGVIQIWLFQSHEVDELSSNY